jgi:hypothetical protein
VFEVDVEVAFEGDHVFEACAFGDRDGGVVHAGVFVADIFDEEEDEDVVLVLAGVPAAAEFVAAGRFLVNTLRGTAEFGFLQPMVWSLQGRGLTAFAP